MDLSNQYLSYEEYKMLGGSIANMMPSFYILEAKARNIINLYTSNRLIELPIQKEEVKMCMLDVIELLNIENTFKGKNNILSSESIDGYSVSFQSNLEEQVKAKNKEIRSTIYHWLSQCKLEDGTPYLYRGN